MKKETVMKYASLFGIPVLTTVIGLILLANPDSATALVTKMIGWLLVIGGAVKAISAANRGSGTPGKWIWAAVGIILGVVVLKNPLWLAQVIGRFIGIILVIEGGSDLKKSVHRKAKILAIITLAAGAVLILTPMSLIRTILRLCGAVVTVIGIVNILEKFQEMKLLEAGSDPNIIDADE